MGKIILGSVFPAPKNPGQFRVFLWLTWLTQFALFIYYKTDIQLFNLKNQQIMLTMILAGKACKKLLNQILFG